MQSSRYDVDGRDRFVGWILLFVQLALLAAVFLLPEGNHWRTPAWLSDGARAFSIFGVVVVGIGLVNLGRSATPLPTPVRDGELRSNGLYQYVRHPIYCGLMVLVIGSAIPSGSIAVASAASALVGWLAQREMGGTSSSRAVLRVLRVRFPDAALHPVVAARRPAKDPYIRNRLARLDCRSHQTKGFAHGAEGAGTWGELRWAHRSPQRETGLGR